MKIVTKYLLKGFVKIFLLCITTFILLLLVMRAQEIAKFFTIQSSIKSSMIFVGCQIPYILPFAIPISALIASFIQMQKLSLSYELTALRAFGFRLLDLNMPFIGVSLILCLVSFLTVSEIAPRTKLVGSNMLMKKITSNPLLLLKRNNLLKVKDSYMQFDYQTTDEVARKAIFAYLSPKTHKINLLLAESLSYKNINLFGENISFISTLSEDERGTFDDLYLENHQETLLDADHLIYLLKKQDPSIPYEMLPSKMCFIKKDLESTNKKSQKEAYFELSRRCFYVFLPFSLVLIGITFGLKIGRESSCNLKIIKLLLITLFIFIGFFIGKSFHKHPMTSLSIYLVSHLISWVLCFIYQSKITRGIET